MAKKEVNKEQQTIARDSISELLMDNDINIEDDIDENTLHFDKTPSTLTKSNELAVVKVKEKAEKIMNSLLRLYVSEGFINTSEYVQAKVNFDSMTLGKIMNQMEISENAIGLLMDEIMMGDVNPKLFDSLGKLQSTFIELLKAQTNYVITVGEEYKKLALEKEVTEETGDDTIADEISNGYKSSNQKDLIRMIRNTINQ